jgi:hypothetical protein
MPAYQIVVSLVIAGVFAVAAAYRYRRAWVREEPAARNSQTTQ